MKKLFTIFAIIILSISIAFAQAPAQSNAIMLQGFYWDSNSTTSWSQLYQISGNISGYFDYVWLPPSAASSGGTGYHPAQLSNQNSSWGSEGKQKQLINYLKTHNCKAIADVVVNHRWNMSTWCDFYPDFFGGTYGTWQFNTNHIVGNDPMWTNPSADAHCRNTPTSQRGADKPSQYEMYGAARNLDHTNWYVRDATKAYLRFMKNEMGYDGWRYDFAKGFAPSYFGEYSDAAGTEISVGEYWDGNYNTVWNWITGTSKKSMAFDFPMKYTALNQGLAAGNYGSMAYSGRPAGLIRDAQSSRYAVTFVDNHDTYRDGNKYTGNIQQAYAFLMSSPGIPCVFYPHWQGADKTAIQNMMMARKAAGVHSESDVAVQNTSGFYKAYSKGKHGAMLTYIGSGYSGDVPTPGSGWVLECSGTGWSIYVNTTATSGGDTPSNAGRTAYQNKIDAGINPPPDPTFTSITLSAILPHAWTTPRVHVWNGSTNITGAWPGKPMTQVDGNKYTITLTGFAPVNEVGVIFNNGSNVNQTIDLYTSTDNCWEVINTPVGGKYNATLSATCQPTSAINEVEADKMFIYPNPVEEVLYINFPSFGNLESLNGIQILDIAGKIILNTQYSVLNTNSIDVSNLAKGIYFVKIGNQIEKFVKR